MCADRLHFRGASKSTTRQAIDMVTRLIWIDEQSSFAAFRFYSLLFLCSLRLSFRPSATTLIPSFLRRDALAKRRSISRRPHPRRLGCSQPAECFLYRRGERRGVEDQRLRPNLDADLRSASRPARSAPSKLRRPIPTLFTSAAGRGCIVPICRLATEFTNPPMAARPGPTLDCAMASRFRRWRLIPTILTGFLLPLRDILTARIPSAASIARPMAARPSRRCSTRTRTSAAGDVKIDPSDPNIVYATLWEAREGPWENGEFNGTNGGDVQVNRRRTDLASSGGRTAQRHRASLRCHRA